MNLIITTKQKPPIDALKAKRKELRHNAKENHQIRREETRRKNRNRLKTTKTTNGNKWKPIDNYFKCKQSNQKA